MRNFTFPRKYFDTSIRCDFAWTEHIRFKTFVFKATVKVNQFHLIHSSKPVIRTV